MSDSDDEVLDADQIAARQELEKREVLIEVGAEPPAKPTSAAVAAASGNVRLGVVTMTKRPANFETWLRHHSTLAGRRAATVPARATSTAASTSSASATSSATASAAVCLSCRLLFMHGCC